MNRHDETFYNQPDCKTFHLILEFKVILFNFVITGVKNVWHSKSGRIFSVRSWAFSDTKVYENMLLSSRPTFWINQFCVFQNATHTRRQMRSLSSKMWASKFQFPSFIRNFVEAVGQAFQHPLKYQNTAFFSVSSRPIAVIKWSMPHIFCSCRSPSWLLNLSQIRHWIIIVKVNNVGWRPPPDW